MKKQIVRVITNLAGVPVSRYCNTWKEALAEINSRVKNHDAAKVTVSRGSYGTVAIVNITIPGVSL